MKAKQHTAGRKGFTAAEKLMRDEAEKRFTQIVRAECRLINLQERCKHRLVERVVVGIIDLKRCRVCGILRP